MPRFAANLSYLFAEFDPLDRFAVAADAGFEAVEIQFPYEFGSAADVARAREVADLEVLLINTPLGDRAAGDRGLLSVPARQADFRAGIAQAIEYADALGAGRCHLVAGVPGDGHGRADCLAVAAENLQGAAERLGEHHVLAMVEAINGRDIPGFFIQTSDQAIELLDRAQHPNTAFQFDAYHMQIMQGDLIETFRRLLPRIGHVQFADTPGRHQPGTGEINFANLFAAIDGLGYTGWVAAEYAPTGLTTDSLDWFRP
jgi:hydroxypyruvate isomerase